MTKYYKVIKDTPLWEEGAILHNKGKNSEYGYDAIEDIWDKHKKMGEYLSSDIVEDSPEFFERVYKSDLDKITYHTAEELKKLYKKFKK